MRHPLFLRFARLGMAAMLLAAPLRLPAAAAEAVAQADSRTGLVYTGWTAREGAPTGIAGIAQTPDGWIWIGSSAGLYRFDGVRFVRASGPEGPLSAGISIIGVLRDGTLWVGYRYGGASLLRDGRMRHFSPGDPATPPGTVYGMEQDGSGRTWLATSRGLYYLDGQWKPADAALGVPAQRIMQLLLDRRGVLWLRGERHIYKLAPGAGQVQQASALKDISLGALAQHPDGSVWAVSVDAPGLYMLAPPDRGAPLRWAPDIRSGVLAFDHQGYAWVDGPEGLARIGHDGTPAPQRRRPFERGTGYDFANVVFEDREHNVWVGNENGLNRFQQARFRALALPAYERAAARAVAGGPGGSAWVDNMVLDAPGGTPRPFMPGPPVNDRITVLHRGRGGVVWIGRYNNTLQRLDAGGVRTIGAPPGLARRGAVYALAEDGNGALWVSLGRSGLYTWRDGTWLAGGGVPALAAFAASTLAADSQGRIWLGAVDNQLAVAQGPALQRYGRADGLAVGTVTQILPLGAGAWIGGENGLAHFDGKRFASILGAKGEPFAGITGLAFARDGTLWINGGDGISGIAPDQLDQAVRTPGYRVRFSRYDYRDGLVGTTSAILPVPSVSRSDDGTLWFSITGGVYTFNPSSLAGNPLVPPVAITGLKVGEVLLAPAAGMRLAPGTRELQVEFTALSFQEPGRMAFRYRLAGVDRDWRDSDGQRAAAYTNLGPGNYRFDVVASNNDGVWNTRGASLSFAIAPRPTETAWFKALCAATALALLAGLYRWRTRRLKLRYRELLHERLAERERIARALHDTLLQSMQGLILSFHGIAKRWPAGSAEQRGAEAVLDRADKAMAEGRSELLNLRDRAHQGDDIAGVLGRFGASLQEQFGPRFTLAVQGAACAIDAAAVEELYWIGREALFNAYQHAQASHVELELVYGDAFGLQVRDDGAGMRPDVQGDGSRAGHWGVPGMRERARALGGSLEIWSKSGAGTEVVLRVPGERVYVVPRPRRRWRRLLAALGRARQGK
jgi:signal transduction histidine kinase/ligand-binding sensor domain-containing protein